MINIDVQGSWDFIDKPSIEKLVSHICKLFNLTKYVINIVITDDNSIKISNNKFLRHDYITDVISFDMSDENEICFDIIINGDLAERKSKELKIPPFSELCLYITHGMLHNLGFDDCNVEKAKKMHKKEDEILHALRYGIVYNADKQ